MEYWGKAERLIFRLQGFAESLQQTRGQTTNMAVIAENLKPHNRRILLLASNWGIAEEDESILESCKAFLLWFPRPHRVERAFVWGPCLVGSHYAHRVIALTLFHYLCFHLETDSLAPAMPFHSNGWVAMSVNWKVMLGCVVSGAFFFSFVV